MRWQEIRACGLGKPANGANNALIMPFAFDYQGGAVVSFIRFGDSIDGKTRAIRSGIGSCGPCVEVVVFDKVCSKACLIHMDGDMIG